MESTYSSSARCLDALGAPAVPDFVSGTGAFPRDAAAPSPSHSDAAASSPLNAGNPSVTVRPSSGLPGDLVSVSTTGWNPVLLGQISTVGFHSTPFSTLGNVGLLRCTDGSAGYGSTYALDDILIDPAAAANDQPTADLRGFAILVSTTTPDDPHQVFAGRCAQAAGLQRFSLPAGTRAKYVELDAIDNDGGSRLAVAEFEVYGRPVSAGAWLRPALRTDVKKAPNTAALASVRTIRSGLAVQPPKKHQVRSSPAPDRRGTTAYQRPASPLRGQLIGR